MGVNEVDYMGGYFGEPVEVVKCETIDLEVPATSEIMIEGYISDSEDALEGPMGEYADYVPSGEGTLKPDEIHFNKEATSPLVAFLQTAEKITGKTIKLVYNCLPPADWGNRLPGRTSFKWNYPSDLQEKVVANWSAYGFGG
ncbi:MAG TPA: UbiD family decarboxylase domain-containing protein [Bryobacteraceae bacterium]|jgi:hypothetical protein|nr:UbiD family decarboxylase domain-containing protein [Bryobacteraceae bacterium]